MEKNNSIKEIFDKIKSSNKILISLHKGPDGDSLGSCMALKYLLERDFNKTIQVISPDNLASYFDGFEFIKEIEFGTKVEDVEKSYDIFLALDFGNLSGFSNKNFLDIFTISLDHHETNSFFGDINYVNANRPSCCSVLLDIFKELKIEFDKELSSRLLLGVYTDSGMFSHGGVDSLRDAVFLIDHGADYLEGVVNPMKYNYSLDAMKYLARVTENFKIIDFEGFKVGVSSISVEETIDLNLELADIRGAPNYLQTIRGVDFLFTLAETKEFIKGSFRSRKNIDVSRFAKAPSLRGGGHKFAAAFELPKISLLDAEKKVFKTIKKLGIVKVD